MSSQKLIEFLRALPNPTVEELRLDWQTAVAKLWSNIRSWVSHCVDANLLEVCEATYFCTDLDRVDLSALTFKTAHGSADARPVKRLQCDSRGVVYLEKGPRLFVLQRHLNDDDWTIRSRDEFFDCLPPRQTRLVHPGSPEVILDEETFSDALISLLE